MEVQRSGIPFCLNLNFEIKKKNQKQILREDTSSHCLGYYGNQNSEVSRALLSLSHASI